jgi:hypothetical protein
MTDIDPFRDWDAAYVLGALGSDERRTYERHLETCVPCSSAVTELAGIPGFLTKISAETASEIVESPLFSRESGKDGSAIQKLATLAIHRKQALRRRVVSAMAIAAAFLMVIGVGIGVRIQGDHALSSSAFTTIAPGTPVTFASAKSGAMKVEMQMANKRWGTQFQWNCTYTENRTESEVPESYDLVVTDPSGAKVVIATWREIGKGATGLVAATSVAFADIRAIEIRSTGSSEPILTAEI